MNYKRFAYKRNGFFSYIFPSIQQTKMCGSDDIWEIDLVEDQDGSYYGWKSSDGDLSMVYSNQLLLEMCFPYGIETEVAAGKGNLVRLTVKSSKPLLNEKEDQS